jgi:hypothetical protein
MENITTIQEMKETAVAVQDDSAYQAYLEEPLPQDLPSEAIVATKPTRVTFVEEADNLSASVFRPADLDKITAFTADELHRELVGGFISGVENSIWMEALAIDARRRMANGEPVGGHKTWTGYVYEYFRRENESIETALRRMRRLLDGVEHAGKKHANKKKKKTNAVIVEEGLIREGEKKAKRAYRLGQVEGRQAGYAEAKATFGALEADVLSPTALVQTILRNVTPDGFANIETAKKIYALANEVEKPTADVKTDTHDYLIVRRKSDRRYLRFGRKRHHYDFDADYTSAIGLADTTDIDVYDDVFKQERRRCRDENIAFDEDGYEFVRITVVTKTAMAVIGSLVVPTPEPPKSKKSKAVRQ